MSESSARIYDVGYRSYDGPRRPPWRAIVTVCLHAVQRVLGLRRSFRHKILPGLAIVIAFLPAIVSIVVAVMLDETMDVGDDLITYGEMAYHPDEVMRAVGDPEPLERGLGWKPGASLRERVDETVQWWLRGAAVAAGKDG